MSLKGKIRQIRRYSGLIRYAFLLAVGLYLYFKFFKVNKGATTKPSDTAGLPVRKTNLSMSAGELDQRKKQIYDAMNKFGTDEKVIFEAFEGLNKDDIGYIFNAFGSPKYFGVGMGSLAGQPKSLQAWLKAELSSIGKYSYDNLKANLESVGADYL